jgi:hypothetical protein
MLKSLIPLTTKTNEYVVRVQKVPGTFVMTQHFLKGKIRKTFTKAADCPIHAKTFS